MSIHDIRRKMHNIVIEMMLEDDYYKRSKLEYEYSVLNDKLLEKTVMAECRIKNMKG